MIWTLLPCLVWESTTTKDSWGTPRISFLTVFFSFIIPFVANEILGVPPESLLVVKPPIQTRKYLSNF